MITVRRFLLGYSYVSGDRFGFGSVYHSRTTDSLPTPDDLRIAREDVARVTGESVASIVILSVSEVSPDGEVTV